MREKIILGAGQCGMKLAHNYHTKFHSNTRLIALSTSTEDSVGIPQKNLVQIATEGSGKKFSTGSEIWTNNFEALNKELGDITETDIIYFTSAGGGSGSSSVRHVSDVLLNEMDLEGNSKSNRIFLIMVLPFGYEALPFKPNALNSISSLHDSGWINEMSILLFDNDKLSKQYFDIEKIDDEHTINTTNLEKINAHIISATSLVLNLISEYHDPKKFSPFTIDEIEHESVIFSNGFIGVDFKTYQGNESSVKFDFGNISSAKNVIIAKAVSTKANDKTINKSSGQFLEKIKKISRKAKNARIMYGIIRTDKLEDSCYIIIANNLNISKYIDKVKNKVGGNIEGYLSKGSSNRLLSSREKNMFDI